MTTPETQRAAAAQALPVAAIQMVSGTDPAANMEHARRLIAQAASGGAQVVVLPEYLFTSYPGRISIPDFAARVGFAEGGPEYEALGGVAQRLGMFLAGNAYETDAAFPDFYFQTSFIVGLVVIDVVPTAVGECP